MQGLIGDHRLRMIGIGEHGVAHVPAMSHCARDIPAAPALFEWAAMVRNETAENEFWTAVGHGVEAAHDHAGYAEADIGAVATQAIVMMDEDWARAELLIHGLKHQALLGILRGHFDEAAVDPSHRYGVIEKDGTRVAGFDACGLQ